MFGQRSKVFLLLLIILLLPWDCLSEEGPHSNSSATTGTGNALVVSGNDDSEQETEVVSGLKDDVNVVITKSEPSQEASSPTNSEQAPATSVPTAQLVPPSSTMSEQEPTELSMDTVTTESPTKSSATTTGEETTAAPTTQEETTLPPTTFPPTTLPPTSQPPATTASILTEKHTTPTSLPTTTAPVQLTTSSVTNGTTTTTEEVGPPIIPSVPPKEVEPAISISIFLIFVLLSICSVLVHLMIKYKLKFLPESIAFVIIGFIVGIFYNTLIPQITGKDLSFHERFTPDSFFLLLLPPIIFESGYSLHKGNFFQNLGSIIVFAVLGTVISTFIVGGGLVGLSKLGVIYELTLVQGFAFGALISAVDPVATLAIFHALDVNPTLNMLVFGESVLNDAVSIVMTKTILKQSESDDNTGYVLLKSLGSFLIMFVGSALIGTIIALCSALFLKYVNLRKVYSLEFAMWVLFAFGPYFFAEGLKLSGIMAVLFCGIVMSHYTHFNLSPVTQVTVQQTMRTVSFMAETVVFLYIGMQVFAIRTSFRVDLIIWSLILILIGRAANIFPLTFLVNRFRSIKISGRMQFIMWFSGLRGAVAYALALNLVDQGGKFASSEVIQVLSTTTLVIVLFTIIVLGGSTLPLLKCLSKGSKGSDLTLSKTEDVGVAPANTSDEVDMPDPVTQRHQWFMALDYRYFKPFLIRRFTKQEVRDARIDMQRRTNEWYEGLRSNSSDEEDQVSEATSRMVGFNTMETSLRERKDRQSPPSSTGSIDITDKNVTHS